MTAADGCSEVAIQGLKMVSAARHIAAWQLWGHLVVRDLRHTSSLLVADAADKSGSRSTHDVTYLVGSKDAMFHQLLQYRAKSLDDFKHITYRYQSSLF